jgi:hypothetical protein
MRLATTALLATVALAALAVPAVAQDEGTEVPVTIITNAEFCALVSDDPVVCEGIISGMETARVVPQSFAEVFDMASGTDVVAEPSAEASLLPGAEASVEPTEDPAAEATEAPPVEAGVGDALARDDLEITLLKADWKPDISDSFYQPGKGAKYVSFLVRYEALEGGARYNIINWDAVDADGTRYEAEVLGQITPDLKVGELAKGDKIQGWVTYEVHKDVNQLQVIESQVLKDDLVWTSKR